MSSTLHLKEMTKNKLVFLELQLFGVINQNTCYLQRTVKHLNVIVNWENLTVLQTNGIP